MSFFVTSLKRLYEFYGACAMKFSVAVLFRENKYEYRHKFLKKANYIFKENIIF